jgi:hypothetical protein
MVGRLLELDASRGNMSADHCCTSPILTLRLSQVVDMLVPYNRTYDRVAWPGSQGYVRFQAHTFWPRHVFTFTKFDCTNEDHRSYQGSGDITMWGDIGAWIHSLLPEYFKYRLMDWPGTYLSKGSPFVPSKKTRAYDDVCSTTDAEQQSFCLNR